MKKLFGIELPFDQELAFDKSLMRFNQCNRRTKFVRFGPLSSAVGRPRPAMSGRYQYKSKSEKIEALMDHMHAERKHVLDNLPTSEPWYH